MSYGKHEPRAKGFMEEADEDRGAALRRGTALSVLWLDEAEGARGDDDDRRSDEGRADT